MNKLINRTVFPSDERTIEVEDDADYGGAHSYRILNCNGFNNGKTEYVESLQTIRFVQKNEDGTMGELKK